MPDSLSHDFHIHTRVMMLEAGMYILRLLASNPAPETCLTVQQSPVGRGAVDFFPAEGVMRNTLSAPGDCIVVRVKGNKAGVLVTEIHKKDTERVRLMVDRIVTGAELSEDGAKVASVPVSADTNSVQESAVSVAAGQHDAAQAASFEPVAALATPAPVAAAAMKAEKQIPAAEPVYLTQLGHIERRGDVTVTGSWLGDPAGQHRLEGFALNWEDMPKGVTLAYSCRSGTDAEPQIGVAGQFVGTRRQAKPITAVAFVLSGPRANEFELSGHVAFAGSSPLAVVPGQELSGPSGAEQLVALQLVITPKAYRAVPPTSPWLDPAATRTFSPA